MQELNTTVILQKASPGRGTLWNKFYAYNQIMPQQHEAIVSSLQLWLTIGCKGCMAGSLGKRLSHSEQAHFLLGLLQAQSENVSALAELKP